MPFYPASQANTSSSAIVVATNNYSANYGDYIVADTSITTFTITLPIAQVGKVIIVNANNGNTGIGLACGSTVNGYTLNSNSKLLGSGQVIFYCLSAGNWVFTTIGNIVVATSFVGLILSYSPTLYWRLQETSGTTISDTFPNGKPGSISVGNPSYGQTSLVSSPGSTSIKFNGNTRIISNSPFSGGVTTASIILRFKTTYSTATQCLLDFQNFSAGGNNYSPTVFMNSSGKIQVYGYPNSTSFTTNSFNDGNSHTLGIAIAGNNCSLYVDGSFQTSISNYSAQSFTGYWTLGASNSSVNTFFQDYLEEFAIIPSALTSSQMAAIHSSF